MDDAFIFPLSLGCHACRGMGKKEVGLYVKHILHAEPVIMSVWKSFILGKIIRSVKTDNAHEKVFKNCFFLAFAHL